MILCILQLNIFLCSKIGDYSHVVNHSRLTVLVVLNSDLSFYFSGSPFWAHSCATQGCFWPKESYRDDQWNEVSLVSLSSWQYTHTSFICHFISSYTHTHTPHTHTQHTHTHNTHNTHREEGLPPYIPEMAVKPATFINYNRTVSLYQWHHYDVM